MSKTFDNKKAHAEGWGLFTCDDARTRIQRLDDPQSIDESFPADPSFKSDDAALIYVSFRARLGSEYHQTALSMHNGEIKAAPLCDLYPDCQGQGCTANPKDCQRVRDKIETGA